MLNEIAAFALSKVGCGYVYGATGWVCSLARRQQQAAQYPEYADAILGVCAKWDGKQCFDCAQLTRFAAQAGGGSLPSGATSQWRSAEAWESKGEIAAMPDIPGLMLYRRNGSLMQHTGVYVGDGMVVDARGSSQGVIHTAFSSYPWTHWAILRIQEGGGNVEEVLYEATVTRTPGANGTTVNLRAEPGGTIIGRAPFGAVLPIFASQGDWSRTAYKGQTGWMDARFLVRVGDDEDGETVTVSREKLMDIYNRIGNLLEVVG